MAQNEIAAAARALCEEKGISLDDVIETIESALAAAYRKDYGEKNQNIKAKFEIDTGQASFYDEKIVVEDMPEEEETEDDEDAKSEKEKKVEKDEKEVKNQKVESQKSDDEKVDSKKTKDEASEKTSDEESEEEKRRFNPRTEIQISEAKELKKSYKLDDVIKTDLEVHEDYGRMAAQTAKQVIIQRVREIERSNMFEEFKGKENEVITGVIQRREGRIVLVDLGRTTGVLPPDGQVSGENYNKPGARIKVYVQSVNLGAKGPEIILSRTSEEIVRKVFYVEIPEVSNGLIEIKAVSREAGSRSKVAVLAKEDNVDPIGSCVGQRGARIQTIIEELGGEKIDIIEYSEDAKVFVANALAPAKVSEINIDEENKTATAMVPTDQLSLAIGKGGQNVRLAAKLTGWRIDVKEAKGKDASDKAEDEGKKEDEEIKKENKKAKKQENKSEDEDPVQEDGKEEKVKEVKPADAKSSGEAKKEKKVSKEDKKEETLPSSLRQGGQEDEKDDKDVKEDKKKKTKKSSPSVPLSGTTEDKKAMDGKKATADKSADKKEKLEDDKSTKDKEKKN